MTGPTRVPTVTRPSRPNGLLGRCHLGRRFVFTLLILLTPSGIAHAQSIRPNGDWWTTESRHFRLTYRAGLDSLVVPIVNAAETAWDSLSARFSPPAGRIDLVLDDSADDTNGWAAPFPGNRVVVLALPPVGEQILAEYDSWWPPLLSHELTHIFMLDAAGRFGRMSRSLFGRVPSSWPLFPNVGLPGWTIEGIPVHHESRFTGYGRLQGTQFEMMIRTAVLEGRFDPIDRASNPSGLWPGGSRPYLYGALFTDHLARTTEPAIGSRLSQTTTSSLLPPALFFDRIGRRAIGCTFGEAWRDWRARLEVRYAAWRDSVERAGLSPTERLLGGHALTHPRVSRDGRSVAFHWYDGRSAPSLCTYDPDSRQVRRIRPWNTEGTICWLPGGGLLSSRLEQAGPYELRSELARVSVHGDLSETIAGMRLRDPDVGESGQLAVAAQNRPGTTRLVLLDFARRSIVCAGTERLDEQWARPRFAPDGRRIAAERAHRGHHDVVLLDASLRVQREVTHDRAFDAGPTFSPDGRWLLFASDRDGTMNLYAADLESAPSGADSLPPLRRVTRLLTGAFWPDVSPDGRWIYFCGYHADGYWLERIPFDPSTWTEAEPSRREDPAPAVGNPIVTAPAAVARRSEAPAAPRRYHPWRSLSPKWWLPIWTDEAEAGTFYGAMTSGSDLLERHAYQLWSAGNLEDRRLSGSLGCSWAGLGDPLIGLRASRVWSGVSARYADGIRRRALKREDHASLSATLRRVRWTSSTALTAAAELSRERRFPADTIAVRPLYPDDQEVGGATSVTYRRTRSYATSFSAEEGIRVSAGVRRHWDVHASRTRDLGYTEGSLSFQAYQPLALRGFARHVLAWRSNFLVRDGRLANWSDVGGISQDILDLYVTQLGGGRFLPVRGFPVGTRSGTRAFSASLEYRFPVVRIERGPGLWPVFLHHVSGRFFVDGGDAWATAGQGGSTGRCTGARWSCLDGRTLDPLVSGGAELLCSTEIFFWVPLTLRAGGAWPLRGTNERNAEFYLALGG